MDDSRSSGLTYNAGGKQFIAGPSIIERNPLLQPMSTIGSAMYSKNQNFANTLANNIQNQIQDKNYDLLNPDT